MSETTEDLFKQWQDVPARMRALIGSRSDAELHTIAGSEGLSLLELVHHLTEANIVAASMMIAALGASGTTYDWSWLWPNKEWTERLGYRHVPAQSSLQLLSALIEHLSNVVSAGGEDALSREVKLLDAPGAETYAKTVAGIIQMEIDHARQHLDDVVPFS